MQDAQTGSPAGEPRAVALDALRGFAILAMLLSSEMPEGANSLPAWMYHAQVPPPAHQFIPNPGITWVDLVFPFFLFSMGASFPLALARRLRSGVSEWALIGSILKRGFLLAFFALFVVAIRPHTLNAEPTTAVWLTAIGGFVVLFPVLARLPQSWSATWRWTIRVLGWSAAILFLALARYPDGTGFSFSRTDIIIAVLANMSVFGAVIWLVTRQNLMARMGIIGIVLATRLSNMPHPLGGWVTDLWQTSPDTELYQFYFLQYLCIVLPGTVAGDLLFDWGRLRGGSQRRNWGGLRLAGLALLMAAFVLVMLVGLKSRWVTATPLVLFALCALGWLLLKSAATPTEQLYKKLFAWAIYWMILGLVLESYEGGIRKDKATISYYFVTSGLANCALILFSIVIESFQKERWLRLLTQTGQNPMIAYAGVNNLIDPVLGLTGLGLVLDRWADSPWLGFWRGVLITGLMAVVASFFTRRKIFWRT